MTKNIAQKTWAFTGSRATYNSDNLSGVSGDWSLPVGNYLAAKLTGRIVYPRPDAETTSEEAYYRKNHSDMPYHVRICVKGMARPLKYSLTTAPAGATIVGELARSVDPVTGKTLHEWDTDYAVVKWPVTASGVTTFAVQVEDQEGTTTSVTWTTTRDDSAFVFLDADAVSSGTGTKLSPLKQFNTDLWQSDNTDTTYAGLIAVMRGATAKYVVNEGTDDTICLLNNSVKPAAYIGYPDEAPVMDTSKGFIRSLGNTVHDLAFYNLIFDGSIVQANSFVINIGGVNADRQMFGKLTFRNQHAGTGPTDNPSCITHRDVIGLRTDLAIVDCIQESTSNIQFLGMFACSNIVVENNLSNATINIANGNICMSLKAELDNITVASNTVIATGLNNSSIALMQQNGISVADQEICYNTIVVDTPGSNGALEWGRQNSSPFSGTTNANDYRNTVIVTGSNPCLRFREANTANVPVNLTADAIATNGSDAIDPVATGQNFVDVAPNKVILAVDDFDANGKLVNGGTAVTARTDNLGTGGAELSD